MDELQPRDLTDAERAALAAGAAAEAFYLVLGRRVRLAGNDASLISGFDLLYGDFRVPPGGGADLEVLFDHALPGEPYRWTVVCGDSAFDVTEPVLAQCPSVVFGRCIIAALTSHYLVHAGCVSRGGRAVVISGASGLGKSTLTAHLAARGWTLLSDEFAPIRRCARTVDPYPLRVGLRPGPGRDVANGRPFVPIVFRSDDKQLVAVEQLSGGGVAAPAEVAAVIFLSTELSTEVATARRHRGTVRCWFTGWSAAVAESFRSRFGVEVAGTGTEGDLHWADLSVGDLTECIDDFRACAREAGVTLAMVEYEDFGEKDYASPPRLLRLPASAGLMELVKRIPGVCRRALMARDFAGKAGGLVLELASALGSVPFYKMTPGRLDAQLALVEAVWRGDA